MENWTYPTSCGPDRVLHRPRSREPLQDQDPEPEAVPRGMPRSSWTTCSSTPEPDTAMPLPRSSSRNFEYLFAGSKDPGPGPEDASTPNQVHHRQPKPEYHDLQHGTQSASTRTRRPNPGMPNSSTRRPQMRQVLLPGSDAREPGRPGRRHGYAKYFLEDAKFFTPNAKTDSMARTRQDLRNDKIDTDQDESDVPPTPTRSFFPDATRSTSVVRDRFRRTVPPVEP